MAAIPDAAEEVGSLKPTSQLAPSQSDEKLPLQSSARDSQPRSPENQLAVLAAMVPEGKRIWFFKIKGDRDLVAAEQEHFKDFLKSVRFTADRGATDGK
jgi:hypothetical protein